jgi:hypothetical protein
VNVLGQNISNEIAFVSAGAGIGSHPTRRLEGRRNNNRHTLSIERYVSSSTNTDTFKMMVQTARKQTENKENNLISRTEATIKTAKCQFSLFKHKWGHCENLKEIAKLLAILGDKEVSGMLEADTNCLQEVLTDRKFQL